MQIRPCYNYIRSGFCAILQIINQLFNLIRACCLRTTKFLSSHCSEAEVSYLKHTRDIYQKKFEKLFRQDFREKVMLEEEVRACTSQAEISTLSSLSSESYQKAA